MAVTGNDLADLVDYEMAFDPTNMDKQKGEIAERSKSSIMENIYIQSENKIRDGIKQKPRLPRPKKTLMMERMDQIEKKVTKRFLLNESNTPKIYSILDMQKKELAGQTTKINCEKIRGRFKVMLNNKLTMDKII